MSNPRIALPGKVLTLHGCRLYSMLIIFLGFYGVA